MAGEFQIGYDKQDEPYLDSLVQDLTALNPDGLQALLGAMSADSLLSSSTVLHQLSDRDPAYQGERPRMARNSLEVVVEAYRSKTGQI